MVNKKITELTNYNPPIDTDVMPIVDITTATTKKITWANIKAAIGGGAVGGGDNIILNSSFIDSNADGCPEFWEVMSEPTLEILPDTLFPAREGNQLKISVNAGGIGSSLAGESQIKVLPNTTYTLSFDYKVAAGSALSIGVSSTDDNAWTNYEDHVTESLVETTPTRVSFTFTTPAFANLLWITLTTEVYGHIAYISHIKLEQGSAATPYINNKYIDGVVVGIHANLSWAATKVLVDVSGEEPKIAGQFTFTIPGELIVGTNLTLELFASGTLTITEVFASVKVAPTDASLIIDVNKNGTTIFTTQGNRPTIATGETSDTSEAPDVTELIKNDKLTVDIDQIGSTLPGEDLSVHVRFTQVVI